MKKIIVGLVIIFLVLCLAVTSFADEQSIAVNLTKAGIVDAIVFEDDFYLSRYEVLKTIMVAIGADDELSKDANMLIYQNKLPDMPVNSEYGFFDFEEPLGAEGQSFTKDSMWFQKYSLKGDQIALAFYNSIAQGDVINGKRYFCFDRKATVAETLTFMVRCLKGTNITCEEAYSYACQLGLVLKSEMYSISYEYAQEMVNINYFYTLLNRFMEQKRYLYFGNNKDYPKASIDEHGTMTYWQYANQRNQEEIKFSYTFLSDVAIPNEEVAKKIAEVYISSYITKHFPYGESKTDEYYFEVKYDEVDNAWLVMQYKANPKEIEQSDMVDKYTGNMIVLDKSTGKVLYVSYYEPRISVVSISPVPWNGKGKAE